MKLLIKSINAAIFLFFICLIFSEGAYAYLDPGSGSYIFQLIIGSLFGVIFAIKLYWNNIKMFLKKILSVRKKSDRNKR